MTEPLSKINGIITKNYLETQPENQYFERKGLGEKDIKPTKMAEELVGMLNADGGVLAFGVADNGEIQDLNSLAERLDDYRKLVFDFIAPPCRIELEEILVDGKLVFLFHVEQDLERIYCRKDNENVFLRVADSNRGPLSREQIKNLEYDKNIRLFEDEIVPDFNEEDLDQELLELYKKKVNFTSGDILDLLYKRNLLTKKEGSYQFKKSTILLFSTMPERYIPSASVRYVRYEGTVAKVGTEHNVIKDQRFENNIPRLIEELTYFLRASLRDYYFLDINQGKFIKVPEYPEEAWLEGIANSFYKDEILFGKLRPYLAKSYLADFDGICSTEFLVYRSTKVLNNRFALNIFLSYGFIDAVNASTYGSKMPRANAEFISNMFLAIPPLSEQKQIIDYLDKQTAKIDQAIALKTAHIEKLKEYKSVLINDVVTGKVRV